VNLSPSCGTCRPLPDRKRAAGKRGIHHASHDYARLTADTGESADLPETRGSSSQGDRAARHPSSAK
jgi:hypothetical protein